MVINGYDTMIGKPLKALDHIEDTIKALALRNDLFPTTKPGVYTINSENAHGVSIFPLPITMTGYDGKNLTVYDERPFRNSKNNVISETELNIMRLTAYLQQDAVMGNRSTLNSSKFICMKAVAGAMANILARRKGLNLEETDTLRIILGHYVSCLFEEDTSETGYVSANAIKSTFRIDNGFSQRIIDDIGYLPNVKAVVDAIKTEPTLFKMKNLTLMEFVAVSSSLMFIGTGSKVVNVMLESPFLMVGFIYAVCTNGMYKKTGMGQQLDPKYEGDLIKGFVSTVAYNYDLSKVM